MPNLVKSRVGDLGGIDQGLTSGRDHRVVQVEVVSGPDDVDVTGAVRADRSLRIGRRTAIHDLDGFGDDHRAGTHRYGGNQEGGHHGKDHDGR